MLTAVNLGKSLLTVAVMSRLALALAVMLVYRCINHVFGNEI